MIGPLILHRFGACTVKYRPRFFWAARFAKGKIQKNQILSFLTVKNVRSGLLKTDNMHAKMGKNS
jgi:hypothetical protein